MSTLDFILLGLLGTSVLIGLVLIPWFLFLFRLKIGPPLCIRCRHRLTDFGIPVFETCPECGLRLDPDGVRYGRRTIRWWWAALWPIATAGLAWLALTPLLGLPRPGMAAAVSIPSHGDEAIERLRSLHGKAWDVADADLSGWIRERFDWAEERPVEFAEAVVGILKPEGELDFRDSVREAIEVLELWALPEQLTEETREALMRRTRPAPIVELPGRIPSDATDVPVRFSWSPDMAVKPDALSNKEKILAGDVVLELSDGRTVTLVSKTDHIKIFDLKSSIYPRTIRLRLPETSAGLCLGPASISMRFWIVNPWDDRDAWDRLVRTSLPVEIVAPGTPTFTVVDDPRRDPVRASILETWNADGSAWTERTVTAIRSGARTVLEIAPAGSDDAVLRIRSPHLSWAGSWTVRTPRGERPIGLPADATDPIRLRSTWSTFIDEDAISSDDTVTLTFSPDVDAAIATHPFAREIWGGSASYVVPVRRTAFPWHRPAESEVGSERGGTGRTSD